MRLVDYIVINVAIAALGVACSRAKSSAPGETQAKKSTLGEKDRDEFGYLIEWYGFRPEFDRALSPIQLGQELATSAEAAYVVSIPLNRAPSDPARLNVLTLRPTSGQECAGFEAEVASGTFSDLTQNRHYLTATFFNYDAAESTLSFVASQVDTKFPCSLFLVTEELPDNAAGIGYRPLYGAVAFAFTAAGPDPSSSDVKLFSTETGGVETSTIVAETSSGSTMTLVAAPNGRDLIWGGRFNVVKERRAGTWTAPINLSSSGSLGAMDVVAIGYATHTETPTPFVVKGYGSVAPVFYVDRWDPTAGGFISVNTAGHLVPTIFGASNVEGMRMAYFSFGMDLTLRVADISNMNTGVKETEPLMSGDTSAHCSGIDGAAATMTTAGETLFAYACSRGGEPIDNAPLIIGRFVADSQQISTTSFVVGHESGLIADPMVSRTYEPLVLAGNDGDIHVLYRSTTGLKLFYAHVTRDNQLTTSTIDVLVDDVYNKFMSGPNGLTASLDGERGVMHLALYVGRAVGAGAVYYGTYVLGATVFQPKLVESNANTALFSRMVEFQ